MRLQRVIGRKTRSKSEEGGKSKTLFGLTCYQKYLDCFLARHERASSKSDLKKLIANKITTLQKPYGRMNVFRGSSSSQKWKKVQPTFIAKGFLSFL